MRTMNSPLGSSLLLLLASCSYNPAPVLLDATPSTIASLAGEWTGTYVGQESARTGTISFTIRAGTDTARGDVLMETPSRAPLVAADVSSGMHAMHSAAPELLSIRFVAVRDGNVRGALEPYIAPDCRCTVYTTFYGRRYGEEIRGDFVTNGEIGLHQRGTWSVRRIKAVATDRWTLTPDTE